MAYKVFTNGSVLNASEINDNLMKQAVAVFSNAAARTAAISSPVEGQLSYLEDTNLYQHWNGSAWVSPFGLTHLNTTTFTAQSSVTVNNVFSASYDNYLVELDLTQNTAASDSVYTLVNGGTPAASNWGHNTLGLSNAASVFNSGQSNQAAPYFFPANSGVTFSAQFKIKSPFLTTRTYSFVESLTTASGFGVNHAIWSHAVLNNTTSYEGFRWSTTAGTITGTIRFYGIRNA